MHDPIDARRHLAEAIRRYLAAHPDAADSEQGVADWWLPVDRFETPLEEVRKALELLAQEGVVETQTLVDGRVIYRAARHPGGMRS